MDISGKNISHDVVASLRELLANVAPWQPARSLRILGDDEQQPHTLWVFPTGEKVVDNQLEVTLNPICAQCTDYHDTTSWTPDQLGLVLSLLCSRLRTTIRGIHLSTLPSGTVRCPASWAVWMTHLQRMVTHPLTWSFNCAQLSTVGGEFDVRWHARLKSALGVDPSIRCLIASANMDPRLIGPTHPDPSPHRLRTFELEGDQPFHVEGQIVSWRNHTATVCVDAFPSEIGFCHFDRIHQVLLFQYTDGSFFRWYSGFPSPVRITRFKEEIKSCVETLPPVWRFHGRSHEMVVSMYLDSKQSREFATKFDRATMWKHEAPEVTTSILRLHKRHEAIVQVVLHPQGWSEERTVKT